MKRSAFTLIELLVVIAIIGIISTLSIVSFSTAREKARIAKGMDYSASILRANGDDLVGRWDFDECDATATSVIDTSGLNHIGNFVGAASWSTDTASGKGCSIDFNGISSVDLGTPSDLNPSNITVSLWMRPDSYPELEGVIGNGRDCCGAYYGWQLVYGSFYGGLRIILWNGSNTFAVHQPSYQNGTWHHVAFTYNGSVLSLYSDGKRVASTNTTNGIGAPASFTVRIGAMGSSSAGWLFDGALDDVRVYSRALNSSEMNRVFAEGSRQMSIASVQ